MNSYKQDFRVENMRQISDSIRSRLRSEGRTYFIETYGCQMNVRDSESISGMLLDCGFTPANSKQEADLILFNTCCVRDHAEKRVFGNIGALKELKEQRPGLIIGVCGCMMQQTNVANKLMKRFPFVDLVFGTNVLHRLPELLEHVLNGNRVSLTNEDDISVIEGIPSHREPSASAFVNIMYGCNNFCSYCIVPFVRGRERSRSPEAIVDEVRALVEAGYSEVTLLGQNVNSYGNDNQSISFAELLGRVNMVDGLKRIRFMSSHPKDLTDDVVEAIAANEKVCPHVHLPVQSGSDRILKLMNRKYNREQYLKTAEKLKALRPDFELTTDIIVGFPGETEEDFADTLSLVKQVGFAAAFTFKYSRRQGTIAVSLPNQIDEATKKERLKRLNALQAEMTVLNNRKYLGYSGEVLIEGFDAKGDGVVYGKYPNFKMVYFDGEPDMIGRYADVTVTGCKKNSLIGELKNG
ncbi:MAG: tRNA (N6-isopentenyl adenosine(37)-C2)-methylthiotransferase MiaB [Clostridia bacterium]|nr:tRNA (N6-isopentenyl adenosine(37)-C2)-methylthiotransferase MiaB [Clostridia bacterium]